MSSESITALRTTIRKLQLQLAEAAQHLSEALLLEDSLLKEITKEQAEIALLERQTQAQALRIVQEHQDLQRLKGELRKGGRAKRVQQSPPERAESRVLGWQQLRQVLIQEAKVSSDL